MEKETLRFCAKYPFIEKAREILKDFNLNEIGDEFIEEAERRIESALKNTDNPEKHLRMIRNAWKDTLIREIVTYPLTKITAAQTGDRYIKQKIGKNEAKKTKHYLKLEKPEKIEEIAKEVFKLEETQNEDKPYKIPMHKYLNKKPRGKKHKLINQEIEEGKIYLDQEQLIELIASHVYHNIKNQEKPEELPEKIKELAREIKKYRKTRYTTEPSDYGETEIQAFPPCMKKIYDELSTGEDVGHQPRFVLATFMVNIGMNVEEMIKPFRGQSDFKEGKTRYHLEHAAGKKGGGTKYKCPSCSKIKTYGLCVANCNVKHPLSYYKKQKKTGNKNNK
ncbi:MAG: hypothetical protein ACOCTT_03295 [archaeon]